MNVNLADVSGFHLLQQYIVGRPDALASEVKSTMNAGGVVWREPTDSDGAYAPKDRWSNLDFLGKGKARSAWKDYWPPDNCRFSWDAIGRVQIGRVGWEWLLVTAFAQLEELVQSNKPSLDETDKRIIHAIEEAQREYKVEPSVNWLNSNTHLTTRLSALSFLRKYGVCVRMLFVYFYDTKTEKDSLLPSLEEWDPAITTTERRLDLSGRSILERRIYRVFLPSIGD